MPCVDDNTLGMVLEGSLEPSKRAEVLTHIETCGGCRRLVATVLSPEVDGDVSPAIRPGERLGRYEVVARIGRGGMGVVYAARDPELSRDVAVKLIRRRYRGSDELTRRLRRESRAMAKLSHPNVTAVYDVGVAEAGIFIALELVSGTSLRTWMAEPRSQTDVVAIMRRAGAGLLAAHRAQIIHRDFKPDNVLIGDDGELVKVTDFGLAQLVGETDGRADVEASTELSRASTLIGTLAYMAPEQLDGGVVDERADQFAFFVTLWEALYEKRPFEGDTAESLRAAIARGTQAPPKPTPKWLAEALARGLRSDPDERFPSMREAADALQPPRRARLILAVAAVLVLAALGAFLFFRPPAQDACELGSDQMAALWPSERRIALARSLVSERDANSRFTASAVISDFDAGTQRWASSYQAACVATRQGHQSADLLDRRVFCLEGKRREMAALLDRFEDSDSPLTQTATVATAAATNVSRCSDIAALATTVAPPQGGDRDAVNELQETLARLRVQLYTAELDDLLVSARAHRDQATGVGYRPLMAEAELFLGNVLDELDQAEEAARAFRAATLLAAASRHDRVAAEALNELLFTTGHTLARHERGLEIAEEAQAAIERLGGDRELEATRLGNTGLVAYHSGDAEAAETYLEKSITLWREANLEESLEITGPLDALAEIYRDRGELSRTVELNLRTLAIRERVLGDKHPHLVASLATLAAIHYLRSEYEDAQRLLDRGLAIQRATLPAKHRELAVTLALQGLVWGATEPQKAVAPLREALAIQIESLGPTHPDVGKFHLNLGSVLADLGKFDEAHEQYLAGLEVAKVALGEDHTDYGLYLFYLADLGRQRGRCDDVLGTYRRAIELLSKVDGSIDVATMEAGLGECLITLERPREAIAPLERSIARLKAAETDRIELGEPFRLLGVAHYSSGKKRQGRSEVERALAIFEEAPSEYGEEIADIKRWLKKNP